MAELSVAFSPPSLKLRRALLAIHPCPSGRGILAKESNGPRLHGGYPISFVPASRGGVYIDLAVKALKGTTKIPQQIKGVKTMNMQRMDNLVRRLNRLELENLWLKRLATFVFVGIAAVFFMGQSKPPDVAEVVESESFILRDGTGRIRARLGILNEKLALVFQDEDGTARASLTMIKDGPPSLNLYDKTGNARAILGYTELGTTRIIQTLENTSTGSRTRFITSRTGKVARSESSLVLFGKDRKVIWRAPEEPICTTCGFELP
jgi:hypothetical protein